MTHVIILKNPANPVILRRFHNARKSLGIYFEFSQPCTVRPRFLL